jgi:hypothetical protein
VLAWADRTIVHLEIPANPPGPPTFGGVNEAIDHATEVFQRYGTLLTGNHYSMGVVLAEDWQVPLRRAIF